MQSSASRVTPLREPDEPPLPPANIEAEQALLGAVLINNGAYHQVAEFLAPEHFANAVHGRIYAAVGKLIGDGQPANAVTLKSLFDQDAALAEIGGARYLAQLVESAVTVVNVPFYGRVIHEMFLRRELITIGQDVVGDAYRQDLDDPVEEQIRRVEERLFTLADHRAAIGAGGMVVGPVQRALDTAEKNYKASGKTIGVETGLVDLDRLLGGLLPGNLEILGGRPSMGKTSIAAGIAVHAAQHGNPVAIFSLEETAEQQAGRFLTSESGVASEHQRRGDLDMVQWNSLIASAQRVSQLPIWIDDSPGLTALEIRSRARRLRRKLNFSMLIVDHLQLTRATGESRRVEVGEISRLFKEIAKELKVPVLLLSQLSRAVEGRDNKRPMLQDLRESGDIESNADRVMFVFRSEYYLLREEPNRRSEEDQDKFNNRFDRWKESCEAVHGLAEIIVAKNRFGPIGIARVYWDETLSRFSNLVVR